ncbi:hypothetical protein [Halococcus sediminicola]|uniref:hypothetical protein n=1 Tax=Halococcus sediminicola TaxID=1264579 RepID=UPI000679A668|nr:hypothetical protein [Halococcus sediminicola]
MNERTDPSTTRRGVMKGIGGLAALSMSGATIAEAEDVLNDSVPSDPHTLDTYRSIVDAIVPRTPQLESELGPEHVPGGLDVELEKFLVWDFNHFQEIRAEMVTEKGLLDGPSDAEMPLEMFESVLDLTNLGGLFGPDSPLDAVLNLADLDLLGLDLGLDDDALEEALTFGPVERYDISFADDVASSSGPAAFELLVETANETTHEVVQNYPYAPAFTLVFDIVAAEFIARGENEDAIKRDRSKFPAGGTFVQLSPEDRLRCLWTIVDGGVIDRLDDLLSPLVPDVGILKYVVMAVNGLHGFGYYTEWSGLGETKTNTPTERSLSTPAGEVQSRKQSGYPGPADGYAANWRHAVEGGFADPDAEDLNLPSDLKGDDVIEGIGGGT